MAEKVFSKIEYNSKGTLWAVSPDLCKSCGLCIEKCPVKCLSFDKKNNQYLGMPTVKCDVEKCIRCKTCETICPDCAISVLIEKTKA